MFQIFKKALPAVSFLVLSFGISGAMAATPQSLGKFGGWQAFQYKEGAGTVCFLSVKPDKSAGKYTRRDPVYLMVTHRPAESSSNVVSFIAGYPYKSGSEVKVTIDGQNFALLGQDDTAWTSDDATDKKLVDAIKRGSKLVVEGYSSRGTLTRDTFSLKGSGNAVQAIDKACGL